VTRLARALAVGLLLGGAGSVSAYEVGPVVEGGTLTGVVKFAGSAPRLKPVVVPRGRDVCGDERVPDVLVLGEGQTVKNSVVLVEGVAHGKKDAGDVVVDTQGCAFVAHVSAVVPGERVRVRNSDSVVHNTQGRVGKSTVFNVALPGKDQMIDVTRRLTRPGVIQLVCEAHPHMQGWLVVHDSPYFAVTDERGAYRIDGIPPGTYRVTMWHEGFRPRGVDADGRPVYLEPRTVSRRVTIGAGAQAAVDFELR
jgi:plastocyanin